MLVTRHRDRPGTMGRIGVMLGEADVNISAMHLARSAPRSDAFMLLALDEAVPDGVAEAIRRRTACSTSGSSSSARSRDRDASRRRPGGPLAVPPASTRPSSCCGTASPCGSAEGRFQGRADTPLSAARPAPGRARRRPPRATRPRRRALPVPRATPSRSCTPRWPAPRRRRPRSRRPSLREAGRRRPLVAEPGLLEIGQGAWEGWYQREVEARWPAEIAGWRRDPVRFHAPGGESLVEVDRRVRAALASVIAGLATAASTALAVDHAAAATGSRAAVIPSFYDPHRGPWTILVGHDGAFKVVLLALLGLPLDRFWTFTQTTTGIAVLDIRNGRTVLRAWNRTEHLAPLELEAGEAERRADDEAAGPVPKRSALRPAASLGRQRRRPRRRTKASRRSATRSRRWASPSAESRSAPKRRRPYVASTVERATSCRSGRTAGTTSDRDPRYS